MTLGLQKGTVVVLHCQLPSYILPRPDFYYVTASVDGKTKKGFVRKSCISVVKAFDHSYRKALAEFDSGLSTMSHSYVYSNSRFDFQKLEEIDEDNSPLFGRATTVELVLLYTPLVLSSLLRGIDDAAWLVKTFDLFSRFYWNWRRPSFFLSDNAVMEGQRVELKQLIVKYWGRFSPTEFSTMKFEQLDHVWRDLFWQGPVTFTSTGAGDNAHILLAKVPFISGTNPTNVQSSLTEQLMSFGDVPEFVKRGALREPKLYTDSNTCLGAGEECYWGNLTARIMVDLGKTWSEDENIFNAPQKAMQEPGEACPYYWKKVFVCRRLRDEMSSIQVHETAERHNDTVWVVIVSRRQKTRFCCSSKRIVRKTDLFYSVGGEQNALRSR